MKPVREIERMPPIKTPVERMLPIKTPARRKDEDARVTAYRDYLKERDSVREQKEKERNQESQIRKAEAEKRRTKITQRLKALDLDDLFKTGVDAYSWSLEEGQQWRIWITLDGGHGRESEKTANILLDRLTAIHNKGQK